MQQTYFCPNCNATVLYGQQRCTNCGTPLIWQAQQTPPPPPQYPNQQQSWGQQPPYGQQYGWDQQQQSWGQHPPGGQQYDWNQQQQDMYGNRRSSSRGNRSWGGLLILLVILLIVAGTIGGSAFATNGAVFKWFTPPVVTSFNASSASMTSGQSATLNWDVAGAMSVSISPGVGTVPSSGTRTVAPATTTTYTLTATNLSGSAGGSATITVTAMETPVISSFKVDPASITAGQSSTLSWNVTGAASASISPDVGTVSPSGSQTVTPAKTTTYTLTATNATGPSTASTTLTISGPAVPAIGSFTASPAAVNSGSSSILSWNVTGATSVSISPGVGTVSSVGTLTITPSLTTIYVLTASNSSGNSTASATVTITTTSLPVITTFTASPGTIESGLASKLQWTVTGAASVSISNDIGTVSFSDTKYVYPTENTTYTLTATNSLGPANASATVTVTHAASAPVINAFTASPISIHPGGTSTLTWDLLGATSITIDQGIGTPTSSFGQAVSPGATTTYTLTATNSAGSENATVTVTVTP